MRTFQKQLTATAAAAALLAAIGAAMAQTDATQNQYDNKSTPTQPADTGSMTSNANTSTAPGQSTSTGTGRTTTDANTSNTAPAATSSNDLNSTSSNDTSSPPSGSEGMAAGSTEQGTAMAPRADRN